MKQYETMTVGQIVTDSFNNANIFSRFGIDFCCNGGDSLAEACGKCDVPVAEVIEALATQRIDETNSGIEFRTWSLDLLSDYILKFHHRNIRRDGPEIEKLLDKVCQAHGAKHKELFEVRDIFTVSLIDLYNHLEKEEVVLFPYIYQMYDATLRSTSVPTLHCGSITAPISVMMAEHEVEGGRYHKIEILTNGYQTPTDGCNSYRLLMEKLKTFNAGLHQHIHLENNIVFPSAVELERKICL